MNRLEHQRSTSCALLEARVLLVEDDDDTRLGIGVALRAAGFAADNASSGAEACQLAMELKPDVVLLDLGLPDMSGFQVLRWLKANLPATRCVVLSAWDEKRYEREALRLGADLYLEKPASIGRLADVVYELLG